MLSRSVTAFFNKNFLIAYTVSTLQPFSVRLISYAFRDQRIKAVHINRRAGRAYRRQLVSKNLGTVGS